MQELPHQTENTTTRRVVATVIDYTIIFVLSFYYIIAFGELNENGGRTVSGLPALVPVLAWFVWFVVFEAQWGKTPGHAIVGLKVISSDGKPPRFGQIL